MAGVKKVRDAAHVAPAVSRRILLGGQLSDVRGDQVLLRHAKLNWIPLDHPRGSPRRSATPSPLRRCWPAAGQTVKRKPGVTGVLALPNRPAGRSAGYSFRAHGLRAAPMRDIQPLPAQGDVGDEACRTEALGGHNDAAHHHIAYNSPVKTTTIHANAYWMEARAEDLLPVEYFHVSFHLAQPRSRIFAYWNKRAVYGCLFKAWPKR